MIGTSTIAAALVIGLLWVVLVAFGQFIAPRRRPSRADAIVCLAGTRGSLLTLQEKVDAAIALYRRGVAPALVMSGQFSAKVHDHPRFMDRARIERYAKEGRITADHIDTAATTWDLDLGAGYMRDQAIAAYVPTSAIITEERSLHTAESARFTCELITARGWKTVVLVTSPFHMRRALLAYRAQGAPRGIRVVPYAAPSAGWSPLFWFLRADNLRLVQKELRSLWAFSSEYRA